MKKAIIIIGIVLIIAVCSFLLISKGSTKADSPYEFAQITKGDLENTVSTTGTIEAVGIVEVGTQVSAAIEKILVDFNDNVKKDQVIAILDTTLLSLSVQDAEANLIKSQAQYDLAKTKYEDDKELYEKNYISEYDFKNSKTDFEIAKSSLITAQTSLKRATRNFKYAVIKSPIDGTVIHRYVEPGQIVAASLSTPTLFLIAEDLSQMEIHALVDECDIGQIKEGQNVIFTVEAYPDETFNGIARQIRLQPETIQNVVNYTVIVDAKNDKGLLLPGMTATVDFIIEQKKDVLLVSTTALSFQPTEEMLTEFKDNMQKRFENMAEDEKEMMKQSMSAHSGQGMPDIMQRENLENYKRIWYFKDNELKTSIIEIGATDGVKTEIIKGKDIEEGMNIICKTKKGEKVSSNNKTILFGTPGRGPRH